MAEHSFLAGVYSSLTPGGAVIFGLFVGAVVSLLSRVAGRSGLLRGRQVQSLHIEMGTIEEAEREVESGRKFMDQRIQKQRAQEDGLLVRRWSVEEVVVDESMGIG